jgi:hypothetical protein
MVGRSKDTGKKGRDIAETNGPYFGFFVPGEKPLEVIALKGSIESVSGLANDLAGYESGLYDRFVSQHPELVKARNAMEALADIQASSLDSKTPKVVIDGVERKYNLG